jgi:hypothetical protein
MERCKEVVAEAGLQEGDTSNEFVGDYAIKGCYAYGVGSEHIGKSFYGTGGSNREMASITGDGPSRYRPTGYDKCPPKVYGIKKGKPSGIDVTGSCAGREGDEYVCGLTDN